MNKYCEYFDIDQEYFPEINESSIKAGVNWRFTYPHKTFVDLIKSTERMLSRATNSNKKGIWIEGAYGTGKSRVAYTLKKLLDCSDDELKEYFDEYDALKNEPDLRDKLLGHKQGKIISAYRYASGSIDGDRALIMAVYESVTKALRRAGVDYMGENTLRGSVAKWLEDDANKTYFNKLLSLPEYRGLGSFAGKTADDLINLLKNPNTNIHSLMSDIFELAKDRGITALSTSMDELITWLTDVIDKNELKAIILVWDEFSAYFKRNRTALDEFQKLAELSNLKPFYLMIVTHMSGSIFSETDQSGKIVRDRFVRKEIELPDSIAFELIKHALKVKEAQKEIWNELANELNSRMPFSREAVKKVVWNNSNASSDVLKGILPLHPLSALLLKNISSAFASNQRSMFNFIKNAETENLQAFQWFIENYSPDNGDILSIDFLWNFFYEKGTDEYSTGTGRSNLDSIIRTVLDTYPKNKNKLFKDEERVLKTVLMMQAISQKLGDSVELFLTTDKNIDLAFEGTELEHNRAINIAKKLVKDGILYAKPMSNGKTQYAAVAISGDQAQIENIKQRINSEVKTISLVSCGDLVSAFSLSPALRFRYDITPGTIENFTATINKITNESSSYKLRSVICFARNDEEQNKIRELIKNAIKDDRYKNLIFIDTSSTVLGQERLEQWIDFAANEQYWRSKDGKLADEMSHKANAILEDWKTDIANGVFTIYSSYSISGEPFNSITASLGSLSNTVLRKYPLSFDNAKVSEQMFKVSGLSSGAKYGIMQSFGGPFQQSFIGKLMKDVWNRENYWESDPRLPISKLKQNVDNFIKLALDKDGRISIGDIFDYLMTQGFMPCNLYAFLIGFLLKEYSDDTYRYSDGNTGEKMSIEKLAEIIGEYIKNINTPIPRYKDKYIEIMTKEQMAFLDFVKAVFGIPDIMPIEQVIVRIRHRIKDLGFPIWCLKELNTNGLDEFIDKLTELSNPENSEDNTSKIVSTIGKMYLQIPTAAINLKDFLTKDQAQKAMDEFLKYFDNGDVLKTAKDIGAMDVLLDVKRHIGSGEALWLWNKEVGEEEIRKLLTDYKIIAMSNCINPKTSSLSSCFMQWNEKIKSIRIPCSILITELPKLKHLFLTLRDIKLNNEIPYDKRNSFLTDLEANREGFLNFFDSKIDIFKNIYSFHLTGFSDGEIKLLYSKLPTNTFTLERTECEKNVEQLSEEIRSEQKKYQLRTLWEDKTQSKTPREWSTKYRTPILSLVPIDLQNNARRLFDAINRNNVDDSEIKFALEFLKTNPSFLENISNQDEIDNIFTRDIIGKFIAVLPKADEVRSRLEDVIPLDHYDWYGNTAVKREIEKFAQSRYNLDGSKRVLKKIEKMDDHKAKDYLKRLIMDNMNVGIEIIIENGDIK